MFLKTLIKKNPQTTKKPAKLTSMQKVKDSLQQQIYFDGNIFGN